MPGQAEWVEIGDFYDCGIIVICLHLLQSSQLTGAQPAQHLAKKKPKFMGQAISAWRGNCFRPGSNVQPLTSANELPLFTLAKS